MTAGQGSTRSRAAGLIAGALILAPGPSAVAQDGGLTLQTDLSLGLVASERSAGGDSVRAEARLRFALDSSTREQSLSLTADGGISADGDGIDFTDPAVVLDYARENRPSRLTLQASYRDQEVAGAVLDDAFGGGDLVAEDGRRQALAASFGLQTGREGPFGADISASFRDISYSDTADPALIDSTLASAGVTLRFTLSPAVALRLTARASDTDTADVLATARRDVRLGFGADLAVSPVWTLGADVALAEIDTSRDDGLGGRITTTTSGTDIALTAARAMANGRLSLSLSEAVSADGGRTSFSLGRSLELPSGSFDATLGLIRFDGSDRVRPTLQLAYQRPLPRGSLSLTLSQTAGVDETDASILQSRLGARFSQDLTAVSGWSVDLGLATVESLGAGADQARADLGLSYRHALSDAVDLAVGLDHRMSYEDGALTGRATTLSVRIERGLSVRP